MILVLYTQTDGPSFFEVTLVCLQFQNNVLTRNMKLTAKKTDWECYGGVPKSKAQNNLLQAIRYLLTTQRGIKFLWIHVLLRNGSVEKLHSKMPYRAATV